MEYVCIHKRGLSEYVCNLQWMKYMSLLLSYAGYSVSDLDSCPFYCLSPFPHAVAITHLVIFALGLAKLTVYKMCNVLEIPLFPRRQLLFHTIRREYGGKLNIANDKYSLWRDFYGLFKHSISVFAVEDHRRNRIVGFWLKDYVSQRGPSGSASVFTSHSLIRPSFVATSKSVLSL